MTNNEKTLAGFVVVFLSAALWPTLPHISLIACSLLVLIFCVSLRLSAFLNGCIVGFLWACLTGHYYLYWQLHPQYLGQNVVVEGVIDSVIDSPKVDSQSTSFTLAMRRLGKHSLVFTPRVRVSWYSPNMPLQQGHKIRLFIKLKSPVGLANKHGFNYQQWLVSKNIVATAYVKDSPSNALLDNGITLRQALYLRNNNQALVNRKWINALMFGHRGELEKADWSLLQNTGTAHLFAVSGMHLGIVFGFTLLMLKVVYASLQLCVNMVQFNSKALNVSLACLLCCVYAWICGFEVPVVRALISISLLAFINYFGLYWRMQSMFLLLLTVFFVIFPFAHLGLSFWFSFIAVCLIWCFFWRFPLPNKPSFCQMLVHTLKLQLFLCVATLPMIVWGFDSLPWVSFIANLVVIPVITFLLVPLCLISAIQGILHIEGTLLLQVIDTIFTYVLVFLDGVNRPSIDVSYWRISGYVVLSIILLCVLFFLPKWPAKKYTLYSAGLCLCLLTYMRTISVHKNTWHVYVFDVGQGSAIVIEANNQFIIYDTGPSFPRGFSMANAVLLPFFDSYYKPKVAKLILSHLDNDHAGGQGILQKALTIEQVMSPQNSCNKGNDFIWQGLKFEVLWPLSQQSGDENNHSCVMRISDGQYSVLLSGDIEKKAENWLLENARTQGFSLQADVLVAPHHGSKTSSSVDFVSAVKPDHVAFTAGYENRWGFPLPEIVQRYKNMGAKVSVSGTHGQISYQFTEQGIQLSRYRQDEYKRWFFNVPKTIL